MCDFGNLTAMCLGGVDTSLAAIMSVRPAVLCILVWFPCLPHSCLYLRPHVLYQVGRAREQGLSLSIREGTQRFCFYFIVQYCTCFLGLSQQNIQYHNPSSLIQQKSILSQFWLKVWNQGVSRAILPLEALGEDASLSLLASGVAGNPCLPCLVDASLQPLSPSSHDVLPVCYDLCVSSFLVRMPIILLPMTSS